MIKRFVIIFITLVFFAACTTTYKGPGPNLSLRGEAARLEAAEYTVYAGSTPVRAVKLGPEREEYSTDSVKPMMMGVSPASKVYFDKSQTLSRISLGILFGALLLAGSPTAFYSGFLVSIGVGFFGHIEAEKGVNQYNQDLHQRLVP